MQFHLEQQIAENLGAGMSRDEARYAAMRTFGNPTVLKEEARDTWGWIAVEEIAKDLRYGLRMTQCLGDFFNRDPAPRDRKSTRLTSSQITRSYAVFCLKKRTRPSRGA